MSQGEPFELECRRIGALPIVNRMLARLRIADLLEAYLPPADGRTGCSTTTEPAVPLDHLFDADRQAMMIELVVHTVREFDLSLDRFHNDSTSITLHGEYAGATGVPVRGKPTVAITFGHSKDHRPDLKQLLWILTVSADGAVPVRFKVASGNVEDSTTHIETWGAAVPGGGFA